MVVPSEETDSTLQAYKLKIQNDLEQSQNTLKELTMMLEQTQAELSRLTQRNQTVTNHLHLIQAQFDSTPREEIRSAYDNVLDTQYRLLVMRGQLEKLQSEQTSSRQQIEHLKAFRQVIIEGEKRDQITENSSEEVTFEMMINAQEAVRQSLSKQMHDGPAQALSNFILRVDIANRLFEIDPKRAKDELAELKTEASQTFAKVKNFISDLRPMMLDDLGLAPTLKKYIENFKDQTGTNVIVTVTGQERRYESYLEVMIFRAVQEILGNVVRHNLDYPVKITINIDLTLEENQAQVSIRDNGKGFETEKLIEENGLGIKPIRERIELLGGSINVESASGQGCRINFAVPCNETDNLNRISR